MIYYFTKFLLYILGKSLAQVAIRWLLQKDIVSSVIIGASTLAQLEANMGAATGWKLTEEEVRCLVIFIRSVNADQRIQLFASGFMVCYMYC